MLYPIQNAFRNRLDLSGIWDFKIDPDEVGVEEEWFSQLSDTRPLAVPGSWNEQYADLYHYLGMAWYSTEFWVPEGWQNQRVYLRVGSANYFARVWLNGLEIGEHSGGHLPFAFEVTDQLRWHKNNRVAIQVENLLLPTRVPPGNTGSEFGGLGSGYPDTMFDFYPYAGLHRPVVLYSVPRTHIKDLTIITDIEDRNGLICLSVKQNGDAETGKVIVTGEHDAIEEGFVFGSEDVEVTLLVPEARFWSPMDPYLYDVTVLLRDDGKVVDRYDLEIGIRTITVEGKHILLNGEPIVLRGCARHEDFYVHGKGLNLPLLVRDYDLMNWIGANSYRTSHYPYSEEEMRMADRCGMLIIDEIPAVGLYFDDNPENIARRMAQAKHQMQELVARDKNHPSVIMWSIANEPLPPKMIERLTGKEKDELPPEITHHFDTLYEFTRELDPSRLVTLVGMMGGLLSWQAPSDVICLNRYWGWYTQPGQLDLAAKFLGQELDGIYETMGKPIILSEFGADTVAGMHSHPAKMWTEEYQVEMIRRYLDVAEARDFVAGFHVWNFADFQAVQSTGRVGGMNLKGVFTRDRKPKMAAHYLRERWSEREDSTLPQGESTPKVKEPQDIHSEMGGSVELMLRQLVRDLDGKNPGVTKTLKFDLKDDGVYRIVILDGATHLEIGDGEADATMQVKLGDAVKIFTRKLNPMVAVMTGKIKLSGDAMAFTILQQ